MVKYVEQTITDSGKLNSFKFRVIEIIETPEEAIELLKTVTDDEDFWFSSSLYSIVRRFAPKSQLDVEDLLDLFLDKKNVITRFESELENLLDLIFEYIDFQKSLELLEKIKAHPKVVKKIVFKKIESKVSFVELEKLVEVLDPNDNKEQNIHEIIEKKINFLELSQVLQLFCAIKTDKTRAYLTLKFICEQKVDSASAGKAVIAAMCSADMESNHENWIRYQVLECTISAIDFDLIFAFQIIDNFEDDSYRIDKSFELLAKNAKTTEELLQIFEKIKLARANYFSFFYALQAAPIHLVSTEILNIAKEKIRDQDLINICRYLISRCPNPEKIQDFLRDRLKQLIDASTDENEKTKDELFYEMGRLELFADRKKALEYAFNIKDEKLRIDFLLEILNVSYEAEEEIENIINALMEIKGIELLEQGFSRILGTIASKEPDRAIGLAEKMFNDALDLAHVFLSLAEELKESKTHKEKFYFCLEKAKLAIEKIKDPEAKLSLLIRHYNLARK